jgi:hypothetical protein
MYLLYMEVRYGVLEWTVATTSPIPWVAFPTTATGYWTRPEDDDEASTFRTPNRVAAKLSSATNPYMSAVVLEARSSAVDDDAVVTKSSGSASVYPAKKYVRIPWCFPMKMDEHVTEALLLVLLLLCIDAVADLAPYVFCRTHVGPRSSSDCGNCRDDKKQSLRCCGCCVDSLLLLLSEGDPT